MSGCDKLIEDRGEREAFTCSCAGSCTTLVIERDVFEDDDEHTWIMVRTRMGTGPGRLSRAWAALRNRDVDLSDTLLTRTDVERLRAWLAANA